MKFHPTPEMMAAAYDLLKTAKPWASLKLPDSDDLGFRVTRHKDRYGHFRPRPNKRGFHEFVVSAAKVTSLSLLLETMGHEMLHLHQEQSGTATSVQHNPRFLRLAKTACAVNGFDPKTF